MFFEVICSNQRNESTEKFIKEGMIHSAIGMINQIGKDAFLISNCETIISKHETIVSQFETIVSRFETKNPSAR